ncbi:hypothetical protein ACLOJK_012601 [Asimina triloba]
MKLSLGMRLPQPSDSRSLTGDIFQNGKYRLRLKSNRELVVLRNESEIWSSESSRSYQTCVVRFQRDANLVIYDQ